jgi:hypothetical protein
MDIYLGPHQLCSLRLEWLDDLERFVLSLADFLTLEQDKPIQVAFIMFLDTLGYPWLRCISFVKTLSLDAVRDHMTLRLVRTTSFDIDLHTFRDKSRDEWARWGAALQEFKM